MKKKKKKKKKIGFFMTTDDFKYKEDNSIMSNFEKLKEKIIIGLKIKW